MLWITGTPLDWLRDSPRKRPHPLIASLTPASTVLIGIGVGSQMETSMLMSTIALGLGIVRAIYQYRALKQRSHSSTKNEEKIGAKAQD